MQAMILRDKSFFRNLMLFVGVDDVHEQGGAYLDHNKLHHPFLASVSKIFSLFSVSEHIGFLAVPKGPEMVDLLFVCHHDRIYFFILHYILHMEREVPCACCRRGRKT